MNTSQSAHVLQEKSLSPWPFYSPPFQLDSDEAESETD